MYSAQLSKAWDLPKVGEVAQSQREAYALWHRRAAAAGYRIEKGFNQYDVYDANDKKLRSFRRRYEAKAYIDRRIDREQVGVEHRIQRAAAELVEQRAEQFPLDRPPIWKGRLPTEPGPAVYRAIAADGSVLYVGVTGHLFTRLAQHRKDSLWWPEATEVDWVIFPDRRRAERAEAHAIARHRPPYNVNGKAV